MKKARNLLIAIAVVAAFAMLIRADRRAKQSAHALPATTPVVGAGIWIADTGDVIQLQYDGTGRSRHLAGGTVHECEFDWSCDGRLLTIRNFPNVLGSFMAHQTGYSPATFAVDKVTDEAFVFRHFEVVVSLTPGTGHEQPTIPSRTGGEPSDAPASASRGVSTMEDPPRRPGDR